MLGASSEHCRGTLEQCSEPPDVHMGPAATPLNGPPAGTGSMSLPTALQGKQWRRKPTMKPNSRLQESYSRVAAAAEIKLATFVIGAT